MDAHVPFIPLVQEGVTASARLVVLLQYEDPLPGLRHDGGGGEAADAGTDDHRVQVVRHPVRLEPLLDDRVPLLLVVLVGGAGLPTVTVEWVWWLGLNISVFTVHCSVQFSKC